MVLVDVSPCVTTCAGDSYKIRAGFRNLAAAEQLAKYSFKFSGDPDHERVDHIITIAAAGRA